MTSSKTPYAGLPDSAFYRRAVANLAVDDVDPVGDVPFTLARTDRIATAGSCFAVHVSRHLAKSGFNFFVTEEAHPLLGDAAAEFGYGVFSARYGNVYTSRQLLQLFDRAFKTFQPAEDVWRSEDGRYFDPFRPNIQPNGFSSEREYFEDRERHFAAVRRLFEQLDVFVFTMGLTELWRSTADGAAYPLCPGVSAGDFDPGRHEYHNLTCEEVTEDLCAFMTRLRGVNPNARVILTVSPVPIIATMEPRHVLVSSTYTKCALRVACDNVLRKVPGVAYFPGYEIVVGNFSRGHYVADDLRSVTEHGVEHVMQLFYRHYGAGASEAAPASAERAPKRVDVLAISEKVNDILCDEEMLDSEAV